MRSVYLYRMKEEKQFLSPWRESNPTSLVLLVRLVNQYTTRTNHAGNGKRANANAW